MTERSSRDARRIWPSTFACLTFGLVIFAGYAFAQTEQALPPPSALKKLSVEELMDIEVTTVSRQESTVGQSPAAIHGVFWDAVDYPLEDIERIEVIRGPGASVWGANAVNGIINIITKPATETQGGLVSDGGGTEEQGFGTFRYGGKLGNDLHYRVYGKGFMRDEQFSQEGDPHEGAFGVTRISIPKSCWRMRSVIGRKEGLAAERARAAAGKISRKKAKGKRK